MLHLAHAARYHWEQCGTTLNLLRADVLLATAYCYARRAECASIYSASASKLFELVEGGTLFDRASVSGGLALSLFVAGRMDEATEMNGIFEKDLSLIESSTERDLLRKLYSSFVCPS